MKNSLNVAVVVLLALLELGTARSIPKFAQNRDPSSLSMEQRPLAGDDDDDKLPIVTPKEQQQTRKTCQGRRQDGDQELYYAPSISDDDLLLDPFEPPAVPSVVRVRVLPKIANDESHYSRADSRDEDEYANDPFEGVTAWPLGEQ